MWLKLDLEGMKIELNIKGYQPSDNESWDYQWCDVDFSFMFPDCINYSKQDDEVMLSCEIETLESKIDDFINDRIKEKETLEFIEPDFAFEFTPSYNKVESGEYSYAAPGHEMSTPIMEWKVNLWSGGLTCNYFSTTFDKDEIRVFRDYLRLVTEKANIDNDDIKEHIKAGLIGGQ